MIIVLCVISSAAVLCYAMLNQSILAGDSTESAVSSVRARYAAESAASLAMHYLAEPDQSPVPLVSGQYKADHYPGEENLRLFSEDPSTTADVIVTNTDYDRFLIKARGTSGNTWRGITATVQTSTPDATRAGYAVGANGPLVLPGAMTIEGAPVSVYGSLTATASQVSGQPVYATNSQTYSTGAGAPEYRPAPAWTDVKLIQTLAEKPPSGLFSNSVSKNKGMYVWNGQTYWADKITNGVVPANLGPRDRATNPANVWFADSDVRVEGSFEGSLIVRNSEHRAIVCGAQHISAHPGMPAVVAGTIEIAPPLLIGSAGLSVHGPVLVQNGLSVSLHLIGTSEITVDGPLMFSGSRPSIDSRLGRVRVRYDADHAVIQSVERDDLPITVRATSWNPFTP
jgi:hypothetical protein